MPLSRKRGDDQPANLPATTPPPGPAAPAVPAQGGDPAVIPDAVLQAINDIIASIPDASDGGGWDMLLTVLSAENMDDLNRPWQGTSGRTLAGRHLTITTVKRRPSAFEGGVEIFLVVDSVDRATGETITWTTSAMAVICQLAAAWQRDWFPIEATVTAAAKPTERGFTPYHLTVTRIRAGQ